MSVKVELGETLQYYIGAKDGIEVNGSTVGQCLVDLVEQFPVAKEWLFGKNGKLKSSIFVNEESVYLKELARPVKDGDKLYIAFVVGGG